MNATGRKPLVFNGTVGTTRQIYSFEFDSIFLSNDSLLTIYYAFDQSDFQALAAGEALVFDKVTDSTKFSIYASAAGAAVRFTLWKQKEEAVR